ncbi:MAG TPA: PQQ-binding-like beta-propeller repeat protein [Gemmataceae bacterium]|nr:PQQ-binding-like beta-propeller repeat protein [Gemmataceae bacterium]
MTSENQRRRWHGRRFAALAFAVLMGTAARADDWPQWLGPRRDGVWRETGILDKFPAGGPKVLWRAPVAAGYSGPAVAQGRVYVTDRVLAPGTALGDPNSRAKNAPGSERVHCLDAASGRSLWVHEYDCPYTAAYPLGPRTTPVVHEGKVYTLGTEGNLLCLDARSGQVVWSRDLKKDYQVSTPLWGFSAHPLLDGNRLICMVGGEGTTVVAFDKDSGKEIWRALTAREPGYCPPMIYDVAGKRQLIIWHAEAINGLDPETGKVYWSQPVNVFMGMAIATPRKEGDALFLAGVQNQSALLRLGATKPMAEVVWRGSKERGLSPIFATPYFDGEYIYGNVGDGLLTCIKADTGERIWETLAPNKNQKVRGGDIFIIKNGNRFFLVTDQGDLIIAGLKPNGYQEISRGHLLDTTYTTWNRNILWSHPAFAQRCVFARNDKEIICVSLAADGS